MLLTTTCLADQTVAEKMRRLAALRTANPTIIELAVDEAVWTYQHGGHIGHAIEAGTDALNDALAARQDDAGRPVGAIETACRNLLESGEVLAALFAIGVGLIVARANGWLP